MFLRYEDKTMKKIISIALLPIISLIFIGCGGVKPTSATSAPKSMRLPTSLSQNEDALYYNKLINQYITNPDYIKTKERPKKDIANEDKKLRQDFIKEFEKHGLSRQDAIKAYRKQKKIGIAKLLVDLPKDASIGYVNETPSHQQQLYGKIITYKQTKHIHIHYNLDNKEKVMQKYNKLLKLFEQLLPESQQWKKINKNIVKKNISYTSFQYKWDSGQGLNGVRNGKIFNSIMIVIMPIFSKKTDKEVSNTIHISFVKVLL